MAALSDEYLTIDELAGAFKASRSVVRQMVADGLLPRPERLTKRTVRWRRSEVEAKLGLRKPAAEADTEGPSLGDCDW